MKAWAIALALCWPGPFLFADPITESPIVLRPSAERYVLGPSLEVLEDLTGGLDFHDVHARARGWQRSRERVLNFSFSHSVFWVRTQIRNPTTRPQEMILELNFPLHDYVDAFVEDDNGQFRVTRTGDRRVFSTREIPHRTFLFNVRVPPSSGRLVYLRFQSHDGLHEAAPLTLWKTDAFVAHQSLAVYLDGLLFGFLLIMTLYNLIVFLSLRDLSYLYYVLLNVVATIWFFSYQGLSFQLFWPNAPQLANVIIPLSICGTYVTHILFARSFLETKSAMRRADRLIQLCAWAWVVILVYAAFGNYRISFQIIAPLILFNSAFLCAVGVVRMAAGHRPARYYVLAFVPVIVAVPVTTMKLLTILPSNLFTEYAIQVGFAISVMIFALGLADRINVIRDEKEAAQTAALEKEIEARRAEEQAAESLRRTDRIKDAFLANTSHELRTPLNGIIGLAEALIAGVGRNDEARTVRNLELIVRSGRRLANLVNDILDFERLRKDDIRLQRRAVDLRTTAEVVLTLMKPTADAKGLEQSNDIPEQTPLVLADEARLEQILHNLLGNAVKYTDRGSIRIGARNLGDRVETWVEDTGIGISSEELDTIFEAFQQGDAARAGPQTGTGLGLSVTRQLVVLHGGSIEVDSKVDRGSRFSFTLPVADSSVPPGPVPKIDGVAAPLPVVTRIEEPGLSDAQPAFGAGGSAVVLLVDDEVVNLEVMRANLELEGFAPVLAANAAEARAYMKNHPAPDLVVLDIMMPQVSGLELAQELRADYALTELPILMVTARTRTEDLLAAMAAGANDYLTKPFEREEFLLRVRSLLALAHTRRDAVSRERARIVSDLHDHLGATLTDLHFLAESARKGAEVAPEFAGRLQTMVGRAVGELRGDLLGLEDLDLLDRDLIGGLNMILLRRYVEAGREIDFRAPAESGGRQRNLPGEAAAALYTVVREVATNDLKYGSGTPTWSFRWSAGEFVVDFRSLSHYRLRRHGVGRGTASIVRRLSQIGGTVQMTMQGEPEEEAGSESDATRAIQITVRLPIAMDEKIP